MGGAGAADSAAMELTSLANPRVKTVARLQAKGAHRRAEGRFCVETPRDLARALAAGLTIECLYGLPAALAALAPLPAAVPTVTVSPEVLAKMAWRAHPEGFVAVVCAPRRALAELPRPTGPALYLVASGLEKPGNLGAMLRSADGAGAHAVLVDRADADLFAPEVVRASTGVVFSLPVVGAPTAELVGWLRRGGVRLVAATPEAAAPYTAEDLTGPTALILGAEATGLDGDWRAVADATVGVPMAGVADSLNVSVTAALLLYEAARQRARGA